MFGMECGVLWFRWAFGLGIFGPLLNRRLPLIFRIPTLNLEGRLSKVSLGYRHWVGLTHFRPCLGLRAIDWLLFVWGLRFEELYLAGRILLVQCL